MAASTRAITPTHTGPFVAPNRPSTPGALGADSRNSNSGATFGAHLTKSPRGLSPRHSPQPFTGAAALADERRRREEQSRQVSPNPAVAIMQTLIGASQNNMSNRPRDASPQPAQMSAPLEKVAKSIVIPEQVTADHMQTSPVSLSSFGDADSTTAPTATAPEATAGGPIFSLNKDAAPHQHQHHHQPIAPNPNDPGNRAFTFPGPMPQQEDPRAPARQMSLPGYNGPKSPSTKRHKCPYCSTDFTRHHNLKSHLLTHSQEKPYECPTCQARFRRLHDLKRHTKLHTGERPHTCPKCGRRFARGDALARHNKGQGGCAGRRSSFSVDDDMADGRGDDMDGVVYEHDGEGEDDDDDSGRRVSEPARKRQNTANSSTQGPYQQHSSTYPPIIANRAPMGHNNLRPLYQPGPNNHSRDQSTNISPKLAPSSMSSLHFNTNQPNIFGPGGMTESPKPLSPGQIEHRLNVPDGSYPGPRSPSLTQQVHQQNIARGTGRGGSPMGLAPLHSSTGPHLPSLPGLSPMINKRDSQGGSKNGPSMLHQQLSGPGTASQPGSMSSHGGSVSSMRDAMGSQSIDVGQFVRDFESRMARMEKEHEQKLAMLQAEVTTLRAQLAQQHQQAPQQQQQDH
jgi:predicted  nucleic acid-binding Zn-ribbon protein